MIDLQFNKLCNAEIVEASLIAAGLPKGRPGEPGVRFYGISTDDGDGNGNNCVTVVHAADDVTDGERSTIGGIIDAYDTLAPAKTARINELHDDCQAYIYAHYGPERQQSLTALLTESIAYGYANRAAYIGQALGWIKNCIGFYYQNEDAINACTTIEQVLAVTWDFPGALDASDPGITLRVAAAMNN